MRGANTVTVTESLFKVRQLEDFAPADHPLRPIRKMVNEALVKMDVLFDGMYKAAVRTLEAAGPAKPPEKLLRANALASVLQRALRAPARGANPVQLAVSLVHRSCHG